MLPDESDNVSALDAAKLDQQGALAARAVALASAEFGVLREACANPLDPVRLRDDCSRLLPEQWNGLLALADEHGVTSLLHVALEQIGDAVVPPVVADELEERFSANVRRSLLQARELLRVMAALQTAGIEAIPYKGLVFSEFAYGDLAMRQAGDIDMLVRSRDLPLAQATVEKLGYTPCLHLCAEELKRYLSVGYEMSFDYGTQRNLLELKWGILPAFYAVDFDMDAMFAAAGSGSFSGTQIRALAQEDLFLVLCVHAAKHCWSRLIWLCDIARLGQGPLDWARVSAKSESLGITRLVRITLGLAHQLLRAEIPLPPNVEPTDSSVVETLVAEMANQILSGRSPDPESLAYFRQMIGLRERLGDRMRFILRLAFTPGPSEWNAVKLWGPLSPLYRLVRIARLGVRLIRTRS
jgi:Uncharacterised nucleotidyltransferase